MFSSGNLFVLFTAGSHPAAVTDREIEFLQNLMYQAASPDIFCQVFELVNRNRITRRPNRIIREAQRPSLRPFRFLVNKN